ncbi:uncharacterized protein LOC116348112 [Contarinia nasturtii]|uniref:uncharacterized protein LOC116348112 n=1 Tax=Contarinia nasturtii TaxID=265458 RepID=UPI0012D4020B|nr:uncharacterized protein LOC116348112 [Contarinia nasturtii]
MFHKLFALFLIGFFVAESVNGAPGVKNLISEYEAKIKSATPAAPVEAPVEAPIVPAPQFPLDPSEHTIDQKMNIFGGSIKLKKQPLKVAEPQTSVESPEPADLPIGEKMKKFGGSFNENKQHADHKPTGHGKH